MPIMSVREKLEQDRFRIEFAAKKKLEIVLSVPVQGEAGGRVLVKCFVIF